MIFNSLEKALYLSDAFKHCASPVGGCKQFTSCKRSGEPVRQAREQSEGVLTETSLSNAEG